RLPRPLELTEETAGYLRNSVESPEGRAVSDAEDLPVLGEDDAARRLEGQPQGVALVAVHEHHGLGAGLLRHPDEFGMTCVGREVELHDLARRVDHGVVDR